ncbi:putative pectinesterase/pectinesterase inhibitor 45 [Elaeis guineensis]|uniref:Pectinesterase n=1 Tax=Elaeis guineensis var. tenera TaxID=51953 RepID=A0A6I9S2M0_ELAGV|nr:pectinesterase [Elaeis guineensis]
MSAFQDFGPLSERRRAERQQKKRKRIMIAGASVSVILILAAVGVAAVMYQSKHHTGHNKSSSTSNNKDLQSTTRAIKLVCGAVDYKEACESRMAKAVNTTSPKALIRASISIVVDEVAKAFNKSDLIKSDDPMVQGAIEDCKELFRDSADELATALGNIDAHTLEQVPKQSSELRNWLSAVMSYQQTCIDGFPNGEWKDKMKEAMKSAKELTSNALAIIEEASHFLSSVKIPAGNGRRLLAEGQEAAPHKDAGFPSWLSKEERRHLEEEGQDGQDGPRATKNLKPNVTVAKDGSGDFKTISEALARMPKKYEGRYFIYVKEGVYEETVVVDKKMVNVTMFGDGSRKTIVTGSKNYVDGTRTYQTATFAALGDGFMGIAMGFRNTAGPEKHQAVALRVQADRAVFLNCRMEGYQDTLYAQCHRQFYRSCIIAGTVDFIFGDAAAIFQNCILVVRRPLDNQQNIVTAQGRISPRETTGFVLHHCRFTADSKLVPDKDKIRSYLGRPWKEYSRTVIMESDIGDFIHKDGYMPWEGDFALKTLFYAEYKNKGPGADTSARVQWPGFKVISNRTEAVGFTPEVFIQGRDWIKRTGGPAPVPVRLGLY